MSTVAAIEQILEHGAKNTTYKLAVLRAVVDYVIDHPGREPRNGLHLIPVVEIARRVLAYYWKLARREVQQGPGVVTIVEEVKKVIASGLSVPGIEFNDPESGLLLALWLESADSIPIPIVDAIKSIRQVLIEQPFQYLKNVGARRFDVFSLMTIGDGALPLNASYEEQRKAANGKRKFRDARTWLDLIDREWACLVLSSTAYEEISKLRFWLRDAIVLRWAKESARFAGRDICVPVDMFELHLPERDALLIERVRKLYVQLGLATKCFYTGAGITNAGEIDHVLPMSRFPVNLFWNLVPSNPETNNEKRARIPARTEAFQSGYQSFLQCCVESEDPLIVSDVRASYRNYYQEREPPTEKPKIVSGLLKIMETSHARLEAAGIEIWSPS